MRFCTRFVGGLSLALALACGGSGGDVPSTTAAPEVAAPAAAAHQYGPVSFKTYRGDGYAIAFKSDTKFEHSWDNIAFASPKGTYTHEGDELVLTFDPGEYEGKVLKLRQIDGCSMAQYYLEYTDGTTKDVTRVYEQKEPKCKL